MFLVSDASWSLHRLAAVDDHGVADHEAAASEHSQTTAAAISSGLPIRPTGSSAITFARPSARAAGEAVHHRGVDVAGTDGVDADVLRGVVEGRRLVRPITPCFAAVYAGLPLMPMTPAPEDVLTIAPPALLEDQRDLVLHAQEHAAEVDVDDPVPLFLVVSAVGAGSSARCPRC